MRHYDVAIAGGGPAGAAAGIVLARRGHRVLLADATPAATFRVGEGLPPGAQPLLRELQVLERVLAAGHRPCHATLSSWGGPALHANDFLFQLQGHGWQLDRARFDAGLRCAAAEAGVEVEPSARLEFAEATGRQPPPDDGLALVLRQPDGRSRIRCRWLVDAGGRAATLARQLGARRHHPDNLIGFHLRLSPGNRDDRDGCTLVEAVADGWWYSVLLPSGERLVTFLGDADLLDHRRLCEPSGFQAGLAGTRHVRQFAATHRCQARMRPRGVAASSGRLDRFVGDHWLAVGDAALSFDPLSAKGIANALYTGLRGGQAVAAALRGDRTLLEDYAAHLADIFRVYLSQLAAVYVAETRWPDAPFWRRRHARLGPRGHPFPPVRRRHVEPDVCGHEHAMGLLCPSPLSL